MAQKYYTPKNTPKTTGFYRFSLDGIGQ